MISLSSDQEAVLLAAASAQLRVSAERWMRQDLPGGALEPVGNAAVQGLIDKGLLYADCFGIAVITEDGLDVARNCRRVLDWSQLRILRRLVQADELVLRGDEWWPPERQLPERDPSGAVKIQQSVCGQTQLEELVARGLAVEIDGRALATGAGEWCTEEDDG